MSANTITGVKQALQQVLQQVYGIKTVYTHLPRNQPETVLPSIVIGLEEMHNQSKTMGNPGRRHIHYKATLYIKHIDPNPDEQASQQAFDDLLDAIDAKLLANKDLNGNVLKSAWEEIYTKVYEPQLAGQGYSILMCALKIFDITVEIVA